MNENHICRFGRDINDTTCFYFCGHFYNAYKENVCVKGATFTENHEKKEAIAYCATCREYLLEKFCSIDTLSDGVFFLEAKKLLILHFPYEKPAGTNYAVYVNIDVSE